MRKGSPKFLQPSDVAPVMNAVKKYIPMDVPLMYGHGQSLKHVPHFRLKGVTHEIAWTVDIYRGNFYNVQIDGWSEQFKSIPSLVSFLWKRLEV